MNSNRYFNKEKALEIFQQDFEQINQRVVLTSTDSYSDTEVLNFINSSQNPALCFGMALNLAIVGFGQNNLGHVTFDGKEIDIKSQFLSFGGKLVGPGARLKESDITPGRLIRFFRFHIQQYLENNQDVVPFLSYKYGQDHQYRTTCFRGAEYLDLSQEQADHLLKAASELSSEQNFNLTSKLLRVFKAKKTQYSGNIFD
jgi:hypothetical protein